MPEKLRLVQPELESVSTRNAISVWNSTTSHPTTIALTSHLPITNGSTHILPISMSPSREDIRSHHAQTLPTSVNPTEDARTIAPGSDDLTVMVHQILDQVSALVRLLEAYLPTLFWKRQPLVTEALDYLYKLRRKGKACVAPFCLLHLDDLEARDQALNEMIRVSKEVCYVAIDRRGDGGEKLWRIRTPKQPEIAIARDHLESAVKTLETALNPPLQEDPRTQAYAQPARTSGDTQANTIDRFNPPHPPENRSESQSPLDNSLELGADFEWDAWGNLSPSQSPKAPSHPTSDPSYDD